MLYLLNCFFTVRKWANTIKMVCNIFAPLCWSEYLCWHWKTLSQATIFITSLLCVGEVSRTVWRRSIFSKVSWILYTRLGTFKGAVASLAFFYLPTNLSEVCTQYVKLNQETIFAISFIYLIFLLVIAFFRKKITFFPLY